MRGPSLHNAIAVCRDIALAVFICVVAVAAGAVVFEMMEQVWGR